MDRSKQNSLINMLDQSLGPAGYRCIEIEWVLKERVLRVYIDWVEQSELSEESEGLKDGKSPSVITIDECVVATKLINDMTVLDEIIDGPYTLEVSSPGVERPLRRGSDFKRCIGQTIEVKLLERSQDRKHGKGRLVDVKQQDGQMFVTLDTTRGPWQFSLSALHRATLVHEWGNT